VRRDSSQTWAAFLKNYACDIWACDFTVAHDLLFRPLYSFVVLQLQTRRIVHTAVAGSPTDDWTAQQLREATPWGKDPKYLVRDRDNKYGPLFLNVAKSTGIQMLRAPVRAPTANAICERFIGSLRRNALITCSSCIPISCTALFGRTRITTTTPGPIRASGSACQLKIPGATPHHQAKSLPRRCWVAYTMPTPMPLMCTDI
jgi:hypothetical protein